MMKRLSLKGLRLSSHPKETVQSADDGDDVAEQEGEVDEMPGTPRKREKKGFFKTLKRKLTGNFKGKRDSVTGMVVVEDDSSSEARDDGSLHCTRAFHSPRRPRSHHPELLPPSARNTPEPAGCLTSVVTPSKAAKQQQQQQQQHLRQPTKEEVSKSEEESSTPTEEEKVENVFLTDAEYGHTSAPFTIGSNITTMGSGGALSPANGIGDVLAKPVCAQALVTVVVSEPETELLSVGLDPELPDSTWPLMPAPLPPPSPGMDSITAASSDSETQGACAPRPTDYSDPDDHDIPPLHAPPPPTASTSAQGDGYEPYDASEQSCRGHLALIGGGIQGDPTKLLPVYDQLKEPPKSWSLTKELFKLSKFGWYWGPITRVEAEEKLLSQTDGAFLVRDSSDERYLLSLSFRSYGRTLHTRIEHCNGVFSFYAQPESEGYYSIVDLIEHSMNDSQTGVFCYSRARTPGSPSFPVRLTRPVSRFTQVRSLQYLCRFVIRQYTRFDHIQKLPLPPRIKGWLEENQY